MRERGAELGAAIARQVVSGYHRKDRNCILLLSAKVLRPLIFRIQNTGDGFRIVNAEDHE